MKNVIGASRYIISVISESVFYKHFIRFTIRTRLNFTVIDIFKNCLLFISIIQSELVFYNLS